MKSALLAALVVSAALIQPAFAQDKGAKGADRGEAAAKQAGCLNCHNVDSKKVGPALKEVAAKHKGEDADKLIAAMKTKPVHGAALKSAKDEDVKAAATWVLSLDKK